VQCEGSRCTGNLSTHAALFLTQCVKFTLRIKALGIKFRAFGLFRTSRLLQTRCLAAFATLSEEGRKTRSSSHCVAFNIYSVNIEVQGLERLHGTGSKISQTSNGPASIRECSRLTIHASAQLLGDTRIQVGAEDRLQHTPAIRCLRQEESLELTLRQKHDLHELIRVETEECRDAIVKDARAGVATFASRLVHRYENLAAWDSIELALDAIPAISMREIEGNTTLSSASMVGLQISRCPRARDLSIEGVRHCIKD